MTPIRRTWALASLALTLLLGACSSSPKDLAVPTLEPQFGTAENDYGTDIAYTSNSRIYVLAGHDGYYNDDEYGDEGYYNDAILRRFDKNGNLIWSREIASETCSFGNYYCGDISLKTHAVAADTRGYSYSLVTVSAIVGDCGGVDDHYVYRYDAAGKFIKSVYLGGSGEGFGGTTGASPSRVANVTADSSGNFYVVRQDANFTDDYCYAHLTNVVAKYSASGNLLWQRPSAVGTLYDVRVSSNGNVFVAGSKGVSRYSSTGKLLWTKSGVAESVTTSGTNTVYARHYTTIRKFDANGKQLWSKTQSGLSGMVVGDMASDGNGNVYLTGKYNASSTNRDVFTRKLNSSGRVLWTKTFGTSAYDDARGIATLNGSEIYLTGSTQGALAHPFQGGGNDGYVRKLSSSGNPVWTR